MIGVRRGQEHVIPEDDLVALIGGGRIDFRETNWIKAMRTATYPDGRCPEIPYGSLIYFYWDDPYRRPARLIDIK